MKITEKLYITRLEKMVKLYAKNMCVHCPMMHNFKIGDDGILLAEGETGWGHHEACEICWNITEKYAGFDEAIGKNCPCQYIMGYLNICEDKTIAKIAKNIIRGWKKDNKQEVDDG